MIVAPLPTWKELLGVTKQQNTDDILTSGSAISIKLIIEGYRKSTQKTSINIMLPDYFCAETEALFFDDDLKVLRYPLNDKLEPDWKAIKNDIDCEEIDIFIFVHYFGQEHDVSKARIFCDLNNAILIEDCAHVLYGYGKIGKKGHFSIYSPHKFLPIPDGGVIKVNSDDSLVSDIVSYVEEKIKTDNSDLYFTWRIRKILLKLLHISKNTNFELGPHYIDMEKKLGLQSSISNYSRKILSNYSYEDLKKVAYKRRENLQIINEILKHLDSNVQVMTGESIESPLFAVYSLEKIKDPLEYVKKIKKMGLNVSFWPSVHKGIDPLTDQFNKLTKFVITIPVHQSLSLNKLARLIECKDECSITDLNIEELSNAKENCERWERILSESHISNITQDWRYGDIKTKADGWVLKRYMIKDCNQDVGVVQVLIKKICGVSVACRVNKGPIFIESYANIDNEIIVIEHIRRKTPLRPFLYVPYAPYTVANLGKMVNKGWKIWDQFGFPTGEVDLSLTEDQIRAKLDSKWRNQLKTAEKKGYVIRSDFDRFDEMLELYQEEQKEKNFKGVPMLMLREMEKEPSPLKIFYVVNEKNEIIAFDMFYIHSNAATYYIGWNNSEEGRRNYLNNLLLFHSAIALKNMGMKKLDLGGIEYIHTESVAKFKDGMKPDHFRQIGELLKWF